jgi:uncharacterized protein (DUF362 family)
MFRKAIAELGGIGNFVKKGQKIVVKPNIGWDKTPEMVANTNPILIKELVTQILFAGAAEVVVFDHTCDEWKNCYKSSGIEAAVLEAGGKIVPGNDSRYYREVEIPDGKVLKKTQIHEVLFDCDAWFNVPVLKVHGGTSMSAAMKNYMGLVWDNKWFHKADLQQCIADSCTWVKKPLLNIVDAYRFLKSNGPKGKSEADAVLVKALFLSKDIVAIDTAATKFAQRFTNVILGNATHIGLGKELKIGTTNLERLKIKRITV